MKDLLRASLLLLALLLASCGTTSSRASGSFPIGPGLSAGMRNMAIALTEIHLLNAGPGHLVVVMENQAVRELYPGDTLDVGLKLREKVILRNASKLPATVEFDAKRIDHRPLNLETKVETPGR